jgi:hypothetical protein
MTMTIAKSCADASIRQMELAIRIIGQQDAENAEKRREGKQAIPERGLASLVRQTVLAYSNRLYGASN